MAFETYLGDTHARPPVATALGYMASIAMHGPPLAVFVSTWLTHSLLIGYSGPIATPVRMVHAYQIPSSLLQAPTALGDGIGGSSGGGAGKGQRRRGWRGHSGRSARRGLVVPSSIKPLADAASAEANSFLAWLDSPEGQAATGVSALPAQGTGRAGEGGGDGTDGKGTGGGGKAAGGGGADTTLTVAVGTPPAMAAPPAKSPKPPAPPKGQTRAGKDTAPAEDVPEEEDVVAPPAPNRPFKASYLTETMAAYYRTYEVFPGMPESFWWGGATNYLMAIEVCVSMEGSVSNVTFQQGANEDVDRLVATAIRSWRYRPRIVGGSPRPFCHPIRIEYIRGSRGFTR
jgi:hypothetical protein